VSFGSIFAGTKDGAFLSINNGKSWTAIENGLTNNFVRTFTTSGNAVFAGTWGGGVYVSADNGKSWTAVNSGLTFPYVYSLSVSGGTLFAGTYSGVFLSADNGTSWTAINSGLTDVVASYLAVSNNTIFTVTHGVWRRPLSDMIQATYAQSRLGPSQQENIRIHGPSRAHPIVAVEFSLSHSDQAVVTVYDPSGRGITLVNKYLGSGTHAISWDTRNSASGCYTVRIQAGSDVCVKSIPIFR
jgi:hypothetical protein